MCAVRIGIRIYALFPTIYILNGTDVGHFRIRGSTETIAFVHIYNIQARFHTLFMINVYVQAYTSYTCTRYIYTPSCKYVFSFIRR